MTLSFLLFAPFFALLLMSFFLSYDRLKAFFQSLLPGFLIALSVFLLDRFLLSGDLLIGFGKALFPFMAGVFRGSSAGESALFAASGSYLLLVFESLSYLTARGVNQHLLSPSYPLEKGAKRRLFRAFLSLGSLAMSSFLLLQFASGIRFSLNVPEGFLSQAFAFFVEGGFPS